RLNRADFKYIDGILSNWNKNNLKTIAAIEEKDSKPSTTIQGKGNYTSNNSKRFTSQNINIKSSKDYDDLEKELLGWYNND
ncbi:DnaD domain protein, partial [Clostridium saudiense]|nr:DnaD domain protein [Clostridium saudiense]